ncbi:hypothetical protein BDZ91DRAFT_722576 [Kalaharituber pfeilii]|nr:hypothetical protein BDZ91DRAFT_722576 [Kalaharituber pfeilii]
MRFLTPLLALLSLASAASLSTTTLTFYLPQTFPSAHLSSLDTTLQLTTTGKHYTALLTKSGEFIVHNVTKGSYLAEVASREWMFAPLRVDVGLVRNVGVDVGAGQGEGDGGRMVVESGLTFRGNEWRNVGERKRGARIELIPLKPADYYTIRETFNPAKLLSSPMILIALVSLAAVYFIPKLIENMDPELKAEFEEHQRKTLAAQAAAAGIGGGAAEAGAGNPFAGFDMAGFLAGQTQSAQSGQGGQQKKK